MNIRVLIDKREIEKYRQAFEEYSKDFGADPNEHPEVAMAYETAPFFKIEKGSDGPTLIIHFNEGGGSDYMAASIEIELNFSIEELIEILYEGTRVR